MDKYTWVDIGSSYGPSDMLAAFLFGQLENMEKITARRESNSQALCRYAGAAGRGGRIGSPGCPPLGPPTITCFMCWTADLHERTALIAHLREAGILAVFHYVPLHSSPFARTLGNKPVVLPVTDEISSRLVRLPMFYDLTDREVAEVASAVLDFFRRREAP